MIGMGNKRSDNINECNQNESEEERKNKIEETSACERENRKRKTDQREQRTVEIGRIC